MNFRRRPAPAELSEAPVSESSQASETAPAPELSEARAVPRTSTTPKLRASETSRPLETSTPTDAEKFRRGTLLWAVRLALAVGVIASVFANMLHANMRSEGNFAETSRVALAIASWAPLAFFAVVEILSRMPAGRTLAAFIRYGAAGVVGGVAAWISYWHMVKVAAHYGESSPHLLPLSVDGLIVVASMCLVELTRADKSPHPVVVLPPAAEPPAAVPVKVPTPKVVPVKVETTEQRTDAAAPPRPIPVTKPQVKPQLRPTSTATETASKQRRYDQAHKDLVAADCLSAGATPQVKQAAADAQGVSVKSIENWIASYRDRNPETVNPLAGVSILSANGHDFSQVKGGVN